jgi:hypothetical protein
MSARKKLFAYFKENGLRNYTSKELQQVGEIDDWARSLRQLKQDGLVSYEYNAKKKVYELINVSKVYKTTVKRSGLSAKDKYRIRNRDGHLCQSCGKGVKDGIKLHVDHKIPIDWGGTNLDNNLWTLCNNCNQAKQNFYKDDFDPKLMKLVYNENSGFQRLLVLFQNAPNKPFTPSILQGISGIRDWTRSLRKIRIERGVNIVWVKPNTKYPNGYYVNKK